MNKVIILRAIFKNNFGHEEPICLTIKKHIRGEKSCFVIDENYEQITDWQIEEKEVL
jgi:hypothetical protein